MEEILKVSDLHIFYQQRGKGLFEKSSRREVVKGVDFSMHQGEIVGLLGESGCGKSTLAKAILGIDMDVEGSVVHRTSRPQMVFQDPYSSLNPKRKIGWLLEEPLRLGTDMTQEERKNKVSQMLLQVGLTEEIADRYPNQLSGGQRQRVSIATALMLSPGLLIADEPVSALDVTIQAQILELLLDIRDKMEVAILFISHDLRVVYQICDRVMVMKDGLIVESGDVETVYENPQHAYTKQLLRSAGIEI